jgi:hypothetical protein
MRLLPNCESPRVRRPAMDSSSEPTRIDQIDGI